MKIFSTHHIVSSAVGLLLRYLTVCLFSVLSTLCVAAKTPEADEPFGSIDVVAESQQLHKNPLYFNIKTNMLYDALAVPNVGMEFYVGKGFSVGAEWMYAWWRKESSHRMWRIYGGDITARYWFGPAAKRKPLTGHHAGIYAGMLTFCFEFGSKGYMGGLPGHNLWDRAWLNAGVEYGYSLPVARRINIDFSIGVGYLGGTLEKYTPKGDAHLWKSTSRYTWIGPTKAEVSLIWLLGPTNRNQ